ncbi:MAG: class I tRNA ligase family protein [Coriobacteriales bacterium]|jgi:methionyl-tRNA synthetase|nr:class I tRNA ligase family protein [Coriobacteriales bacterium]
MPYGNKGLHFGHIGGVFVPADVYARFLRDRIGAENVLFVCGTDCYGSPIDEGYRKLVETEGFAGSIEDYVRANHDAQTATLKNYAISLDIYEGSGLGKARDVHADFTAWIIRRLFDNGFLHKLATAQFYDLERGSFLNGRQVCGRCPVPGCKSEHGYADECDLGHQYLPADLINPISTLSGQPPVMRDVTNWYFDLPAFKGLLQGYVDDLRRTGQTRDVVSNTIEEFLVAPIIYVKEEFLNDYQQLQEQLPAHRFRPVERGKQSFELEFASLQLRDEARTVLDGAAIRYRTGKTLVPFRITGNIAWGVPAPDIEDTPDLTVWCWPESLWAPISFSKCWLENQGQGIESLNPSRPMSPMLTWEDFWCDPQARVYQFIGQDNIYFYGVAQTAMWAALPQSHAPRQQAEPGELQQSQLVANYHLQFLGKKASSSGAVKPPMADELLDYYTPEQLRAHFIALGLGLKPVSFQPKPLNPTAQPNDADPVLKEGQLLTNVFNRLARSCFYEAQKSNAGLLPIGRVHEAAEQLSRQALLDYEWQMYRQELHAAMETADSFIRSANKYWSEHIKAAGEQPAARLAVLTDSFYLLKTAALLMHPIAPVGTRMIFDFLALDVTEAQFFSWKEAFSGFEPFLSDAEKAAGGHALRELPPRTDFFSRHPSQF